MSIAYVTVTNVSILGVNYKVYRDVPESEDKRLESRLGYCSNTEKKIVLVKLSEVDEWKDENKESQINQLNQILRHEIIHAFLNESGLGVNSHSCSNWADDEEVVDWIATQLPKIYNVCKELGCVPCNELDASKTEGE